MKNSVTTLIKDVILALVAWGICYGLLYALAGHNIGNDGAMGLGMLCAGIPFGWRWASKIITATSIPGIGIKLVISLFLGFIAIILTLGSDVIRLVSALIQSRKHTPENS